MHIFSPTPKACTIRPIYRSRKTKKKYFHFYDVLAGKKEYSSSIFILTDTIIHSLILSQEKRVGNHANT